MRRDEVTNTNKLIKSRVIAKRKERKNDEIHENVALSKGNNWASAANDCDDLNDNDSIFDT